MPGCIVTVLCALYQISRWEMGSDFIHWAMSLFFPFLEMSASLAFLISCSLFLFVFPYLFIF